jgi:hypothetical protein
MPRSAAAAASTFPAAPALQLAQAVRENFRIPVVPLLHIYYVWWLGDASQNAPPFRGLRAKHLGRDTTAANVKKRRRLADLHFLMGFIDRVSFPL